MLLSLFILSVVEWSIIPAQVSYGLVWSKAIQQVFLWKTALSEPIRFAEIGEILQSLITALIRSTA
jgi:hypothetical protein